MNEPHEYLANIRQMPDELRAVGALSESEARELKAAPVFIGNAAMDLNDMDQGRAQWVDQNCT